MVANFYIDDSTKYLLSVSIPLSANEIMERLGIKSKETLRNSYLNPAIENGLIRMTLPDKRKSKNQRYFKYDGYFVSLTMDAKKLFAEIPRAKINVTLDLDSPSLEHNIVGLDYNAFENLGIDTLTVRGGTQTFYLLEKSLFGTNLQTLKTSTGIMLDGVQNAIDNEYSGVII